MGLFGPVGSEMASKMTDALFGSTADSKRYVRPMLQIGSIVRVNYGEDLNKLATVVDIIDSGRLLVEGPENLTGAEEGPHHQAHVPHRPGRRHHTECPSEAAEQGEEGCRHPGEVGQVCIRQDAQEARNSCFPQRFRSLQGHARAQVEVPEACRRCQEDAQVRQVSWTVPWCAAPYTHLASRIQQK